MNIPKENTRLNRTLIYKKLSQLWFFFNTISYKISIILMNYSVTMLFKIYRTVYNSNPEKGRL